MKLLYLLCTSDSVYISKPLGIVRADQQDSATGCEGSTSTVHVVWHFTSDCIWFDLLDWASQIHVVYMYPMDLVCLQGIEVPLVCT